MELGPDIPPATERPVAPALAALPALAACLLVLALSCGRLYPTPGPTDTPAPTVTPTPTPTPTPLPDPRAILTRASNMLAAEQYLGFALVHPVGSTPLATGLLLAGAEGTASLPDRFQLALDMEASGTVFKLQVIVVEEQAYMTNLFSGEWEPVAKEQIPFRFDFVTESVTALLAGMEDAIYVGEAELEGVAVYHIRGTGPTRALARLIPGALPDDLIPVELWVDKTEGRLRRAQLTGPLVTGDLPDTVRVVHLRSLDAPPDIEEPEVAPAGQ